MAKKKDITKQITVITQNESEFVIQPELTPDAIIIAKMLKAQGQYKSILALFLKLLNDNDNLAGNIDIRKEAAKNCKYRLPELPENQKEYFEDILDSFMTDFIEQTIDLKMQGILFQQMLFEIKEGVYFPKSFKSYKNIDLRIVNDEVTLFIDDKKKVLPELNFIIYHKDKAILESLLKYYVFFSFALNNWAQFTETYGKPTRIGKYNPGSNKNDIAILKSMVTSLGTDLSAVIPDTTLIEFLESQHKSGSADLYKDLANFVEERETRRILGQTMTTKESSNAGFAQATVQNLVRQDILVADLRDASHLISDILTRLNNLNFNSDKIKVEIFSPKIIDPNTRITVDEKLNNIINIDPKYFYETYEIPEPEDGMSFKVETDGRPSVQEEEEIENGQNLDPNLKPRRSL